MITEDKIAMELTSYLIDMKQWLWARVVPQQHRDGALCAQGPEFHP